MEYENGEFKFTDEELLVDELEVNTQKLGKLLVLIAKDLSMVNKLLSRNTEVIALLKEYTDDDLDEDDRVYISKLISQNIKISKSIRRLTKAYSDGVYAHKKPRKYTKRKKKE